MPESLAALIPALTFLASASGAGLAAAYLMNLARGQFPAQHNKQVAAMPLLSRLLYAALYSPRYARRVVFVLAALLGVVFAGALALATQQPLGPALDQALAASLSIVVSQLLHGAAQPSTPRYARGQRKADNQP